MIRRIRIGLMFTRRAIYVHGVRPKSVVHQSYDVLLTHNCIHKTWECLWLTQSVCNFTTYLVDMSYCKAYLVNLRI